MGRNAMKKFIDSVDTMLADSLDGFAAAPPGDKWDGAWFLEKK